MRKKYIILFLSILGQTFFYQSSYAQGLVWEWLNPLPQGDGLRKVHFVDNNQGWITSDGPKLLSTVDGGKIWKILPTGVIFNDIHFIDSTEGWGVGTTRITNQKWSVYHTKDGGETWEIQLADTTTRYGVFFLNENIGWVSNNKIGWDELLFTTDGGATWKQQAENLFRLNDEIFDILFLDEMNGWTTGGILFGLQTTDGGLTWARDSSLTSVKQIFFLDSQYGWARHANHKLSCTIDGGETWQKFTVTDKEEDGSVHFFAVDSNHCFFATTKSLYYSRDGGQTWTQHSQRNLLGFFFFDTLRAVATTGNQILGSNDGGKLWDDSFTTDALPEDLINIQDVDFIDEKHGWIAATRTISTGSQILSTQDSGKSWQSSWSDNQIQIGDLTFVNKSYGWAVGGGGAIIHTKDGGINWDNITSNTTFSLTAITFLDTLQGWIVGGLIENQSTRGIILHTNDGGLTWIDQTPGNIPRLNDIEFIDSLNGWAAGGGASVYDTGSILRTQDGGQSWDIIRKDDNLRIDAFSFVNQKQGWAIGLDKVSRANIIHTQDGGETWNPQPSANGHFRDIQFLDDLNGWVVGLFGVIYRTNDGGKTWMARQSHTSQGLTAVDFINSENGWAVGWNRTILRTRPDKTTFLQNQQESSKPPSLFRLIGNYPNPFNATTKIRFEIYNSTVEVSLAIYNLKGQIVRHFFRMRLEKGTYEVDWDGRDDDHNQSASGLYFYHLEVGGARRNGKALLLR